MTLPTGAPEPRREWLQRLPQLIADVCAAWDLTATGEPFGVTPATSVLTVRSAAGEDLVLKLVAEPAWAVPEIAALQHWAGHGAVRLMRGDAARGALLLERALPGTDLFAVCYTDDRAATAAAAEVILRLHAVADPPPRAVPDITTWTALLRSADLASAPTALRVAATRAAAIADELPQTPRVLLHGDLHHANILRAGRAPWLAIDPKGLAGPRAAESAALLRNPRRMLLGHANGSALLADRIAVLREILGHDVALITSWGYVLAVVAAAWSFEDRGGADEIAQWLACADLLHPLLEHM